MAVALKFKKGDINSLKEKGSVIIDSDNKKIYVDTSDTERVLVATADYNDLNNQPTIPTVNNSKITLTAGSGLTGGGDFTLNRNSNATLTLNVGQGIGLTVSDDAISLNEAGSNLGGVKTGGDVTINNGIISVNDNSHNHEASNITSGTIATARLPAASGTAAGITVVYPAASCTTFSSDSGTITPLAAQKAAKQFAIPKLNYNTSTHKGSTTVNTLPRFTAESELKESKIVIEDVTNTRDSSKTANVLVIPAEGGKKMVYGYCTDQVDGTSFIGGVFDASATEYPYRAGLAIGGTSGNLLWKGAKVAVASDIPTVNNSKITIKQGGTEKGSFTLNQSGTATIELTDNNTTYTFATGDSNGQIKVTPSGGSAQNVSVKGLGSAAYTASTAYRASSWTPSASDVGAVPTSRKVNGKALSSDITLSASDVSARPNTWTPSASDVGAVPTSRTVNGLALSSNITLSASNVGALPTNPVQIELNHGGNATSHGGYIDFHFGGTTTDYTSRIIENISGSLSVNGLPISGGAISLLKVGTQSYGSSVPSSGTAGQVYIKTTGASTAWKKVSVTTSAGEADITCSGVTTSSAVIATRNCTGAGGNYAQLLGGCYSNGKIHVGNIPGSTLGANTYNVTVWWSK